MDPMDQGKKDVQTLKSRAVRLRDGWRGLHALHSPDGDLIPQAELLSSLSPRHLLAERGRQLKLDGDIRVYVHSFQIGTRSVDLAVKIQGAGGGLRSLREGRALRNFRTAAHLLQLGLDTAWPIVAWQQVRAGRVQRSILVTQYLADSSTLYDFVRNRLPDLPDRPAVVRSLALQTGRIFACLHAARLWHRDAKAGNFLVVPRQGGWRLVLIDLDGILPWRRLPTRRMMRGPAKLASTLLWSRRIRTTDYLRTIRQYGRVLHLSKVETRNLFRRIRRRAVAERLTTFVQCALESSPAASGARHSHADRL